MQNATHVFSDDGIYNVTLIVTDLDGTEDVSTIIQVTVRDTAPTANFTVATPSPFEGSPVQFEDRSTPAADNIISWYWTFGDGWNSTMQNPTHVYSNNGIYNVTLKVFDSDSSNATFSYSLKINDTSPIEVSITTLDGSNEYDEDEEITFVVNATASRSDITSYSWDFSGTNFVEDQNTTANSVSQSYNTSGLVRITVRVWDGDSYTQSYIEITIINLPPDANFTYQINGGNVSFSAAISSDTESDQRTLQFRWYIEGAWSEWSGNPVTYHVFSQGGTYPIRLEVKDDNGKIDSMTRSVILELNGPTIELIDPILRVNVSEPITVRAAVTDASGVGSVILQYIIGDITMNVTMTLQGTSTYFGQIPAQDHEVSVVYRIIARDNLNNVATTDDIVISVVGDTDEPVISTPNLDLEFEVDERIVIYVTVTDESDISSVILQYVLENITYNVTMTLEDADIYFGQIPAQNHTMKLIFRIIAEDAAGNIAITEDIELSIVEPSDDLLFLQISLILLAVLLTIMTYLFLSRPIVDEVFVMYHDGTLLAHQTRRLKPGMDDEILGGMLIALQNFVRDSFKDESSTVLRRMDFGERKLLVERKDDFFMAVVLSGKRAGNAAQRMLKVLDNIEDSYAGVLKEWDGDLEKVRGIRDETKPMFSRANPLDRLKRKEGGDDSV